MIWVVAESLGIDYGQWVKLYQSKLFHDDYPDDNARFQNIVYVDAVDNDRESSLLAMRLRMFSEHDFIAAVFIGGMKGILEEFDLFRTQHPAALAVPVASAGGAAATLTARLAITSPELTNELDYVKLFHEQLGVSVREQRYQRPEEQPAAIQERMWQLPTQ